MIIDMNCRLTSKEAAQYYYARMVERGCIGEIPALEKGTVEAFFEEIEAAGITTAVSTSGNNPGMWLGHTWVPDRTTPNDLLAEVQKQYPGKFIGVAGIDAGNVFHNALEELERCVKVLGLRVVFIEPGHSPGCMLNDRRLYPIYQKCVDLDVPIILQTSGRLGGKNIDYANPKYTEEVAEDFPDLHIIMGHGCSPFVREAIVVAARRDNVWVSPDGHVLLVGRDDWVQAINENMYGFQDKYIFGSNYPIVPIKKNVDKFFSLP